MVLDAKYLEPQKRLASKSGSRNDCKLTNLARGETKISTEDEKQEKDREKNQRQRHQFTAEGDVEFEAVLFVPSKASRNLYEIEHYFSLYFLQGLEGIAGRELLKLSVQFMGLAS
ncbi:hypothetical protein MKW92_014675 [Papaver armeniacum]|nr:hypothetical protein MKW92_014675 [Papaver armeniacum]